MAPSLSKAVKRMPLGWCGSTISPRKSKVAEFIERCSWAAHERDALALADAAHQAVDARRIDLIRLFPQQPQHDRAIRAVSAAGKSEGTVQFDLDSAGRHAI